MSRLDHFIHAGLETGQRLFRKQLRLGITGLRGAGKTALLTSLVHQLQRTDIAKALPFFHAAQHHQLLGVQIQDPQNLMEPQFPFVQHEHALLNGQWPESTTGWSKLRLQLRVKPAGLLWSKLKDFQQLDIEIIDYPGEWLLDLPMLDLSYEQWSQQCWQLFEQPIYAKLTEPFMQQLLPLLAAPPTELSLIQAVEYYRCFLTEMAKASALILQPGRLLQPAELAGTPVLQLLPLPPSVQAKAWSERLTQHYGTYCERVIKPFYKDYFATIDRQIIVVDCLGALNHGFEALQQMQQALLHIQRHYRYGPEHWWLRLFSPRIDKVALVASKADQLTVNQHRNLSLLLQQMLQQSHARQKFEGCESLVLVAASVICSQQGEVQTATGRMACVQGKSKATGELVTLYPGDVPMSMPSAALFKSHEFAFPELLPPGGPFESMRLDQLIEFLLGDYLK